MHAYSVLSVRLPDCIDVSLLLYFNVGLLDCLIKSIRQAYTVFEFVVMHAFAVHSEDESEAAHRKP